MNQALSEKHLQGLGGLGCILVRQEKRCRVSSGATLHFKVKRMCTELILMLVRALGVTSDFFLPEAITCRGDPESGSPDRTNRIS